MSKPARPARHEGREEPVMLKFAKTIAIAAALLAVACAAQAQTEAARPAAIEDAAWLAGREGKR